MKWYSFPLIFIAVSIGPIAILSAKHHKFGEVVDSKPSDKQVVETTTVDIQVVDAGISEDERKIQVLVTKFTLEEIEQMWYDLPHSDQRPETVKNNELLYQARKRLKQKSVDLSKPDAVNEKLRGL